MFMSLHVFQIEDGDLPQYQNIIIQHMDISEPLTTLRKLLEARLQCTLQDHEFYLQDSIPVSEFLLQNSNVPWSTVRVDIFAGWNIGGFNVWLPEVFPFLANFKYISIQNILIDWYFSGSTFTVHQRPFFLFEWVL